MIVLALSTGSRLDFVSQSRVFFLQTCVWILCATVCKAEQYFNVEVRAAVCVCASVRFLLCLSPIPFPYPLNEIKQPAMSASIQGTRPCWLPLPQPAARSVPARGMRFGGRSLPALSLGRRKASARALGGTGEQLGEVSET